MPYCIIYTTTKDKEEALKIGRTLVKEKLVACANILPESTAIYEWEGEMEENAEVVLLLKTRIVLQEEATKRVAELHSYDVPCILTLPINSGYGPYLQWLSAQTQSDHFKM